MKRSFAFSDWCRDLTCNIKRNRLIILLYALSCVVFVVIGVVVGVNIEDKVVYVQSNGASVFSFLRGDSSAFAYFFRDFFITALYALFAASMFFFRYLPVLSLAPCLYLSYVIGLQTTVIIGVYSGAALPMLFVLYVPTCLVQIVVLCYLSKRCFSFTAQNCRCKPTSRDVKFYYKSLIPAFSVICLSSVVKVVCVVFFGSALIGIVNA